MEELKHHVSSNVRRSLARNTKLPTSIAYNQNLSQRRAAATIKALTNLDVEVTRLRAIGYGELKPVASNKTAEGRAANRRVTAVISK